jgi:hypothetical protein
MKRNLNRRIMAERKVVAGDVILRSRRRWWLIGILLSFIWAAGVGLYGLHRLGDEVHRERMFCYRVRAEAHASPRCAVESAPIADPVCRFKDADCDAPIRQSDIVPIAGAAIVPPVAAWICALIFTRLWRRRPEREI